MEKVLILLVSGAYVLCIIVAAMLLIYATAMFISIIFTGNDNDVKDINKWALRIIATMSLAVFVYGPKGILSYFIIFFTTVIVAIAKAIVLFVKIYVLDKEDWVLFFYVKYGF